MAHPCPLAQTKVMAAVLLSCPANFFSASHEPEDYELSEGRLTSQQRAAHTWLLSSHPGGLGGETGRALGKSGAEIWATLGLHDLPPPVPSLDKDLTSSLGLGTTKLLQSFSVSGFALLDP